MNKTIEDFLKEKKSIKPVKLKKQWAVFAADGNLQWRTISDTKKEAEERTVGSHELGEYT